MQALHIWPFFAKNFRQIHGKNTNVWGGVKPVGPNSQLLPKIWFWSSPQPDRKKSFFDDFPYPPLAAPLPLPLGAPLPPLPLPFGPLLALMISSKPMSILSAILLIDLWFWNCKRFNRKHIWTIAHVSRLHEIAFHWNVCPAVLLCSLLVRFLKQNE